MCFVRAVLKVVMRSLAQKAGYDLVRVDREVPKHLYPLDFDSETIRICHRVRPYTMTSPERICALTNATRYVVQNNIPGAFVECGVWKGGSSMAIALTLLGLCESRDLFLYDTYSGMPAPSRLDISYLGEVAEKTFLRSKLSEDSSDWCLSPLATVKENLLSTGYDEKRIRFIQGKVEQTIPANAPNRIALLRLDTDWYESTRHELIHLFPLLSDNGVLLIDDYGYWEGARKAVDEYLKENNINLFLNRIDSTGRLAIKTKT